MVDDVIKVVVVGMENAGKSTIVNVLLKSIEVTPGNLPNMNPTKGVSKNRLNLNDKNIAVWDFGGQEVYRTDYVANPDKYFNSVSYLYYVIDSQDYYRVVSSIMYFSGIVKFIKKLSPRANVMLLFHKNDPGFDSSIKKVREKFLEKVGPVLDANQISYQWYETSIFDLSSIHVAFGQI